MYASMVCVDTDANSDTDAGGDERQLAHYATVLADGIERALGPWVQRCVERVYVAWADTLPREVAAKAEQAGGHAAAVVGPQVRAVLETDVDDQRVNPLQVVRAAVTYPTGVLQAFGVPPVVRDHEAERQFPDDLYDLVPAAFADLDPGLHEPGLVWGAAKAHVVLRRRREEGRR